jgi:hypothetical protein
LLSLSSIVLTVAGSPSFFTDPSIVDRAGISVDVVPDNVALALVSPLTSSRCMLPELEHTLFAAKRK